MNTKADASATGAGGSAGQGSGGSSMGGTDASVLDARRVDAAPDVVDAAIQECKPGTFECDAMVPRRCTDLGVWKPYTCGPLALSNVDAIDVTSFAAFTLGFRCKTLTVCGVSQGCNYFAVDSMLGSRQSGEAIYYDGRTLNAPEPVQIKLDVGAASQCMNPNVTIQAGESFVISVGPSSKRVYLPAFSGHAFVFYVREDGATFEDKGLTKRLQGPPG
ncbi:MAG TPA: hypothetical protein VJT73_16445 [Polyangiaceae bacterium]|nr:hypothetical protein [Polyangiaceae bacterium]